MAQQARRERSFERFFVTHYERVVLIAYKVLGDRQSSPTTATLGWARGARPLFLACRDNRPSTP